MSDLEGESVGLSTMVTNAELAKDLTEQREKNSLLEHTLEAMRQKLEEVAETTEQVKEKLEESEDKGKAIDEEDVEPEPDPSMQEEPFLKALKTISGKSLEGIPLFIGKMDLELVMEWIEGIENHFECKGLTEAQKVKVAKSRLRRPALT